MANFTPTSHIHTLTYCTSNALWTSCRTAGLKKAPWTLAAFSSPLSALPLSLGRAGSLPLDAPHRGWINPRATASHSSTNRVRFLRNTAKGTGQPYIIWKKILEMGLHFFFLLLFKLNYHNVRKHRYISFPTLLRDNVTELCQMKVWSVFMTIQFHSQK